MYSQKVQKYIRREWRRYVVRRLRQGALLLVLVVVALWGYINYQADHRTFAWDKKISVAVVALLDGGGKQSQKDAWFVQRFLSRAAPPRDNLREVETWIQKEFARHTGDDRQILDVVVRGPLRLRVPPPLLPGSNDSFLVRWQGTRRFLSYFNEVYQRDELLLGKYDLTLFIYFYNYSDKKSRELFAEFDSVASRRSGLGIVFCPISNRHLGYSCAIVAHELCHTLGASDKYDGSVSVYPDGFAEPDRRPLYPQRKAEIMSLGLPVKAGKDEPVRHLRNCIVGTKTAREVNWRRR